MAVYYINLAIILGLAWPLCIYKPNKIKKLVYLLITFGFMWFLATFRYDLGYDYNSYIRIFEQIRETPWENLFSLPFEWGFLVLSKAMTLFIQDHVVMYGVYQTLIFIPIVWFLYKYCDIPWQSTWLYVTLAFWYITMNFTRQSLACSIIVMGYDFLRKKKTVPFLVIVVLAALFHKTALIMIPVYFFCHLKLTRNMIIFYSSATVLLFLCSQWIVDLVVDNIAMFSVYKDTVWLRGLSTVFLLVPFSMLAACICLKKPWKQRDSDAPMLFHLVMFSAIIWLFITRHFILERFSMYLYIFTIVAVPSALTALRASPQVYEDYALMQEEQKKGKHKSKEQQAKMKALAQNISDHQKYYWSAVVGMLIITFLYNDFGANVNKFHGVFPYQSVLSWLGVMLRL